MEEQNLSEKIENSEDLENSEEIINSKVKRSCWKGMVMGITATIIGFISNDIIYYQEIGVQNIREKEFTIQGQKAILTEKDLLWGMGKGKCYLTMNNTKIDDGYIITDNGEVILINKSYCEIK